MSGRRNGVRKQVTEVKEGSLGLVERRVKVRRLGGGARRREMGKVGAWKAHFPQFCFRVIILYLHKCSIFSKKHFYFTYIILFDLQKKKPMQYPKQ